MRINRIENASSFGKRHIHFSGSQEYSGSAALIIDPPRRGYDPTSSNRQSLFAERIVYVSCEPATQARDVQVLIEAESGLFPPTL